jgi:uncharacterized protein
MDSGIYVGTLRHRRFHPARHDFSYPLFMVLLDLHRLPELMRVSPLADYNRWNCATFQDRDHFGNPHVPLHQRVTEDAARHHVELGGGGTFLLTHLRYFGYNFNPVSFFYNYDNAGGLRNILAEVNNTFGETQNYWLTSRSQTAVATNSYRFHKSFHVSPFMPLTQEYAWTLTPPGERLTAHCINYEKGREMFDATLQLERREWSRKELHRALVRFPLLTAKVVAAIHWQGIKLMMKKVPIIKHPGPGHFQAVNSKALGASWKTD